MPKQRMPQCNLLESLDVLRNRLGLLFTQSSHALVARCLAPGLAFGYVLRQFIYLQICSLERGGLHRRFAFTIRAVATCTLFLVESCPILCCTGGCRCGQ